jgi:organic hydroperoxide reductase OsmC/OhrA
MAATRDHQYRLRVEWTGNLGEGTSNYRAYTRDHRIEAVGKPPIESSSDPAFRGDPGRYNPEELLVAAISSCHMLWYLHFCADAGIRVVSYLDEAKGTMREEPGGRGSFTEVVLRPRVTIAPGGDAEVAEVLHERATEFCFVARSVNFPVRHQPLVTIDES